MLLVRRDGVRLHVARQTNLERDATVVHVLRERFVFDEASRMADSVRATDVDGLAHGRSAVAFTGVTGACELVLARVRERRSVYGCRVSRLGTCEIERNHALVPMVHG